MPAPRTGLHDAVLRDAVLHDAVLRDAVLRDAVLHEGAQDHAGLAGTGLAGTGLAGTGLDDTETAPLAALTWTLPRSFENELTRLARFAETGDGALYGGPAHDGAAHDGAAHDGAAHDGAAHDGAAHDGAPDTSVADTSVADNRPPGRLASAERPPGYRPPSHSRRRSQPAASAASSRPVSTQQGVVRGLLVTPWFAAATGFVIAVSLWIYSPHPQLAQEAGPYLSPCTSDDCTPHVSPSGGGSLYGKSKERVQQHQNSAKPAKTDTLRSTHAATSGLSFGYVVRPDADGTFWLMVTVTGKHPIKDWHLAFELAGAHIQAVFGADWHRAGSHGGTASPFTGDPGEQHGWPSGGGDNGYGQGGAHDQPGVFFAVLASGKPVGPTHCSFNGASCTFRELSSPGHGEPG